MTDLLAASWRKMLGLAREGKPEFLIEALINPETQTGTDELDADGRRILRYTFRPLPDDPGLRREILEAFVDMGRRGNGKRGRKRAIPARDVGLVRGMIPYLMNAKGYTREAAEEFMASWYSTSVGTVQDVLRQRKTYVPGAAPQKEARRLRGKITR